MTPANPAEDVKARYAEYLATPEWRMCRDEAVARAEGRCQLCNSDKRLNVHHRTYERLGSERDADLIVLCEACHEHFHGITGGEKRRLTAVKPKKRKREPKREASVEELQAEFGSLQPRIRQMMASYRRVTIKQIVKRSGRPRAEIKTALTGMVQAGELYEVERGFWMKRPPGVQYRSKLKRPKERRPKPLPPKTHKPWDRQTIRDLEFREGKKRTNFGGRGSR